MVSPGGFVFGGYAPPVGSVPPDVPASPQASVPPDAPTVAVPLTGGGAREGREVREAPVPPEAVSGTGGAGREASAEAAPAQDIEGGRIPSAAETGAAAGATSEEAYYLPPEVDYGVYQARAEAPPEAPQADAAAEPAKTQAMGPVAGTGAVRGSRVICPECYASNPELNSYCQECGSPLPMASLRQPGGARPRVSQAAPQRTMAMPPQAEAAMGVEAAPSGGAYTHAAGSRAVRSRGEKSFGVADALAVVAVAALAASLLLPLFMEGFTYKSGLDIGIFSHQGAYVRGRLDLLGGPGLLPYGGTEFLTVGLVVALGLALTLLFLALRVGRGPMFLLAGCLLLLPISYIFFQAILPLREMGVEIQPAAGLGRVFFGSGESPGMGLPLWMISAAALLLVIAGFVAPPRGWGRLFSFVVFMGLVLGAAFFCAACYNWNIFITGAAAGNRCGGAVARVVSLVYTCT